MTDTIVAAPTQTDALAERLFQAVIGALEVASVHLGARLGLYRALADGGAMSSSELAACTGTAERYMREWLEQQAVAGFLDVDDPQRGPTDRRYGLPPEHRSVLVDELDLRYLTPLATLAVGVIKPIDLLAGAYVTGEGIRYEDYGADVREGIEGINRPMFENQLAGWLASIPEVDDRLRARPPARVADLACGSGWSSVAIARAYPDVIVDAVDVDAASIERARRNIDDAGVGDRVRPVQLDASAPTLDGPYDLVTIFEALHDMNHPIEALASARRLLASNGSVVIADERVADRFDAPGDEIERFNYGWSVLHCLPVGMIDADAAGTGTVMRPDTVREYAAQAGFATVEILPIEHEFWRFFRLRP